jgi:hypothetical protein
MLCFGLQEDLSETTPAVGALCKLLLSDQLQEIQQFVPQIVQVGTGFRLQLLAADTCPSGGLF